MSEKKSTGNISIVLAIGSLFILSAISASVYAQELGDDPQVVVLSDDNNIILTFSFDMPVITEETHDNDIFNKVLIEGLPLIGDVGMPMLPLKPVNVLLPQRTSIESITVTTKEAIVLGDGYNIELGTQPVPTTEMQVNALNINAQFNPMVPFPTADFEEIESYDFRGYNILTVNLYPVRYLGATGELEYYSEMTLKITTAYNDYVSPLFRGSPKDEVIVREMVNDYSKSNTYVISDPINFQNTLIGSNDLYEYVIITNETLKNSAGEYTFQDLIQNKIDNGLSATIVTIEDIYATYDGIDKAEKIRNFIKDAYLNWETEFVLLGGDSNIVPVREFFTYTNEGGNAGFIASDLYFACLDGSFNDNGNDLWGEPDDGENGGDVDLRAEVYVGRACIGNESEISNFVMKTLAYEQTPIEDPYLKKALMVGEFLLWAWGGDYKDEMINGSSNHGYSTVGIPTSEYNVSTLYDRDWENNNWPNSELKNRINDGINVINHIGHAGAGYNMKLERSDVCDLINDKYCFIYSQGCTSGAFHNAENRKDCIAEYFTVKTSNAAFAGIWNANKGWGKASSTDGPSQKFDREFYDAIFNEGVRYPKKKCIGVANQDSKEDNIYRINEPCMRWCYYELNLFGDPQIALKPVPIPDHDLAVDSLTLSDPVLPDEPFTITTKIFNQGQYDETNIFGNISISEIVNTINFEETQVYEHPWTINYVASGNNEVIELTHTLPRGLYRISSNIYPHPEEEIIFNNYMSFVVFVGGNVPPEQPAKPEGPPRVWPGQTYDFSTSTIDLDGDQVYYQWFWGVDRMGWSMYSYWLGPYESGETITTSHTWTMGDYISYDAKARAMDVYGEMSNWSQSAYLSIDIRENQQNNQCFSNLLFLRFLERFPNAFPILRHLLRS